jgi:hypothetical protein
MADSTPKIALSRLQSVLPDYAGGSLVNLMASIAQACGGAPLHAPLRSLGAREIGDAQNVVLLIIDGLGERYLARRAPESELGRRRRAPMTSVFPSTTASAITTSYTGRTPLEHGLTGWFSYFGEAGCVGAPLPFTSRGDNLPLDRRGFTPQRAFAAAPLFPALAVQSFVVTSADIVDSTYNLHHCEGATRLAYAGKDAAALAAHVETAVKSSAARKFVYAYWPFYDRVSHRYGSESAEAFAHFQLIDRAFGELIARLAGTDSLLIATADHGFVDVAPGESHELPAALAAELRFPLCGERRIAYCHVRNEREFIARAKDWLGDRADVRPSGELAEEGWFGDGEAHPRFAERIGDVALVMRAHHTVKDWIAGEPRHLHIGNHGGTREADLTIPLVLAET